MDIRIPRTTQVGGVIYTQGSYTAALGNAYSDAICLQLIGVGAAINIGLGSTLPATVSLDANKTVLGLTDPNDPTKVLTLGGGITTGRTILTSSTLALTDANTRISCNHATVPVVCTIPNDATVAWANETIICLYQGLAAACSFAAGAGVTIHALDTSVQYGIITAIKTGSNEWTVQK